MQVMQVRWTLKEPCVRTVGASSDVPANVADRRTHPISNPIHRRSCNRSAIGLDPSVIGRYEGEYWSCDAFAVSVDLHLLHLLHNHLPHTTNAVSPLHETTP